MRRRMSLGSDPGDAFESLGRAFGADASALASAVRTAACSGADLAPLLESVASDMEQSSEALATGGSASAGARLSARMIAALPLCVVPLMPMARAPLTDSFGIVSLLAGAALAVAGMVWIDRLLPRWPGNDAVTTFADRASAALTAGLDAGAAFERALTSLEPPVEAGDRVRRLAGLGADWTEAMERAGDGFEDLGVALGAAESTGAPLAVVLDRFADNRRRQRQRSFDATTRRAPVLMVLPLTLCVLPSFGLLALVPFLRGLSLA